jgi:molybdopterin converting factor small subunit
VTADAFVTVRYFAAAREAAATSTEEVPATTVAELLETLRARHGDRMGRVLAMSSLLVDGSRLSVSDDAPLAPGGCIDVLPPFAGG